MLVLLFSLGLQGLVLYDIGLFCIFCQFIGKLLIDRF